MKAKSRRRRDGDGVPVHALRHAAFAQLIALMVVGLLAIMVGRGAGVDPRGMLLLLAMLQGALAAIVSVAQGAPPWWRFIHVAFMPMAVLLLNLNLSPAWYLAGFLLLLAIFWRTDQSRVPLYLSNTATTDALLATLPQHPCRVIDLGCGEGGLLRRLARARPDCRFTGIEHAPLTWLIARIVTLGIPNVRVSRGDFWATTLADYQVVYAFLSPAPMARLWAKACSELAADAVLISNSFPVPDVMPARVIDVNDRRQTRLYCYHPGRRPEKTRDSGAYSTHPARRDPQ